MTVFDGGSAQSLLDAMPPRLAGLVERSFYVSTRWKI